MNNADLLPNTISNTFLASIGYTFLQVPSCLFYPLSLHFFYPAKKHEQPITLSTLWQVPRMYRYKEVTPLEDKAYPTIIYSHGFRGNPLEQFWLLQGLINQGYLIVSVEHLGNAYESYDPVYSQQYWKRAQTISEALDYLLQSPGKHHIQKDAIGFIGNSQGGLTGLLLAGAQFHKDYKKKILQSAVFDLSKVPQEHQESIQEAIQIIKETDYNPGKRSFKDERIKAFMVIIPAFPAAFDQETLKSLSVPVQVIAGYSDTLFPKEEMDQLVGKSPFMQVIYTGPQAVNHYTFLNLLTERGKKELPSTYSYDPEGVDRSMVHQLVLHEAVHFFNTNLQSHL